MKILICRDEFCSNERYEQIVELTKNLFGENNVKEHLIDYPFSYSDFEHCFYVSGSLSCPKVLLKKNYLILDETLNVSDNVDLTFLTAFDGVIFYSQYQKRYMNAAILNALDSNHSLKELVNELSFFRNQTVLYPRIFKTEKNEEISSLIKRIDSKAMLIFIENDSISEFPRLYEVMKRVQRYERTHFIVAVNDCSIFDSLRVKAFMTQKKETMDFDFDVHFVFGNFDWQTIKSFESPKIDVALYFRKNNAFSKNLLYLSSLKIKVCYPKFPAFEEFFKNEQFYVPYPFLSNNFSEPNYRVDYSKVLYAIVASFNSSLDSERVKVNTERFGKTFQKKELRLFLKNCKNTKRYEFDSTTDIRKISEFGK